MNTRLGLVLLACTAAGAVACHDARGQSAEWQEVVGREPQVRYLLADMTLNGGRTDLYRKYAKEERDPDSIEAVRLWDAGARVVNTNEFGRRTEKGYKITNLDPSERKTVGGKILITRKGSKERISGALVKLSTDLQP